VTDQRSFIYVLQHANEQRIKIGRSIRPGVRARNLPDTIDLGRSLQIEVDRRRAHEIEAALHNVARKFAVKVDHNGDGSTEWFDEKALPIVLAFVERNAGLFLKGALVEIDGAGKTLVARFTVPQWRRLRGLAVELDTSIQQLFIAGLSRLLTERDQPPLNPEAPDFHPPPTKKRPPKR
jgi:hypothetical protein